MKKKLYLLVVFIVINTTAQNSLKSNFANDIAFNLSDTRPPKEASRKTSKVVVSVHVNVKKETLIIRSTHHIEELSIKNLQGKKLIQQKNQNTIGLTNLTRGVYILEIKTQETIISKKIILQ